MLGVRAWSACKGVAGMRHYSDDTVVGMCLVCDCLITYGDYMRGLHTHCKEKLDDRREVIETRKVEDDEL